MVKEVKAFKADDGFTSESESLVIKRQLAVIIERGSCAGVGDIANTLVENDSKVVGLLQQYRKLNPKVREKGMAAGDKKSEASEATDNG